MKSRICVSVLSLLYVFMAYCLINSSAQEQLYFYLYLDLDADNIVAPKTLKMGGYQNIPRM
jgi:hypothetical protein